MKYVFYIWLWTCHAVSFNLNVLCSYILNAQDTETHTYAWMYATQTNAKLQHSSTLLFTNIVFLHIKLEDWSQIAMASIKLFVHLNELDMKKKRNEHLWLSIYYECNSFNIKFYNILHAIAWTHLGFCCICCIKAEFSHLIIAGTDNSCISSGIKSKRPNVNLSLGGKRKYVLPSLFCLTHDGSWKEICLGN